MAICAWCSDPILEKDPPDGGVWWHHKGRLYCSAACARRAVRGESA